MDNAVPLFDSGLIARYDQPGPRYTSYPSADRFESRFPLSGAIQALASRDPARDLSLYFHIPFCETLCFYCGCHRIPTRKRERGAHYVDDLIAEMALVSARLAGSRQVSQIHLGGGTPTFLLEHDLERLMAAVRRMFVVREDAQCGIEVDPRRVDAARVDQLARLGFNRISLGVQDFDPRVQVAINRVQSEAETVGVIAAARAAGFASVSVDLITGLPHQNVESFARTLERIVEVRPDRIAVYGYAHLPARFPAQLAMPAEALPDAATRLALGVLTHDSLRRAGYACIGMDHFALAGDELAQALEDGRLQRNFQGYSTHAECETLGFGVTAISFVGNTYLQNTRDLGDWEAAIASGRLAVERGHAMSQEDRLRAAVIQEVMCRLVVDTAAIGRRFGIDFDRHFATARARLEQLRDDGLIAVDGALIRILPLGRLLIRHVAMAFDAGLASAQRERYSQAI